MKSIIIVLLIITMFNFYGCTQEAETNNKLSAILVHQIDIKRQFMLSGDKLLLKQISDDGLIESDLSVQKVVLYVNKTLNNYEESSLREFGVKISIDSWLPAIIGNHYGSYIAEIPVDKMEEVAKIDFIVRIDTVERQGFTGCNIIHR